MSESFGDFSQVLECLFAVALSPETVWMRADLPKNTLINGLLAEARGPWPDRKSGLSRQRLGKPAEQSKISGVKKRNAFQQR